MIDMKKRIAGALFGVAVPAEQRSNCEAAIRAVVGGWSDDA